MFLFILGEGKRGGGGTGEWGDGAERGERDRQTDTWEPGSRDRTRNPGWCPGPGIEPATSVFLASTLTNEPHQSGQQERFELRVFPYKQQLRPLFLKGKRWFPSAVGRTTWSTGLSYAEISDYLGSWHPNPSIDQGTIHIPITHLNLVNAVIYDFNNSLKVC